MVNGSRIIRLRPPGKSLQCLMNMFASCRATGLLKPGFGCFDRHFKGFRTAYYDLTAHKLPAEALFKKEFIQSLLEHWRFRLLSIFIASFQVSGDVLNDVINLEPLTPVNVFLNLFPNIRIRSPVIRIWPFLEHSARDDSHVIRLHIEFVRGLQNDVPKIFRCSLANGNFLRLAGVAVAS